jgi:hypothetical protein
MRPLCRAQRNGQPTVAAAAKAGQWNDCQGNGNDGFLPCYSPDNYYSDNYSPDLIPSAPLEIGVKRDFKMQPGSPAVAVSAKVGQGQSNQVKPIW